MKKMSMTANQKPVKMVELVPTKSMILNANVLKDLQENNVKKT